MQPTTLRDIYLRSTAEYATRPAFSLYEIPGESLTYSDFARRVESVADTLQGAGISRGDKVALLSTNMPNWSVCYFAVVSRGMVVVPILPDFAGPELDMILTHAGCKGLMVSDKLFSRISKRVVDRLSIVIRTKNLGIICQGAGECAKVAGAAEPAVDSRSGSPESGGAQSPDAQSGAAEPSLRASAAPEPDDLAAIIYTSGTTSTPKGVMLTHRNLVAQLEMDNDLFPIRPDDIFLSILPLSHSYECSIGMLLPYAHGASVVYIDKAPTPSTLVPAMQSVRPTVMLSVPLIIEKIYRNLVVARFSKRGLMRWLYARNWFRPLLHRMAGRKMQRAFGGRIRFFGVGGAKLDEVTERFLREARFPYAIGYGLTETAPLLAGAIPGQVPFRSTGPMLKGVEARLENVNPETGEGELVVLSPSTMQGYYKNPEATASVFTPDGWFRTKDLGSFDSEGNLYIKGRVDSMIVGPSGENIYPEEIESVLNGHSLVADSLVLQASGGKLVAKVRFDSEALKVRPRNLRELKNEVLRYVNSKVAKSSQIAEVEEQESDFRKTPTQKIKRFLYTGKGASGKTKRGGR